MRARYSGSIYPRGPAGILQIQYRDANGVMVRESAKTTSRDQAQKLLNKRLAEARAGETKITQTTVSALADLYLNGQRARWKPETYKWTKIICENHIKPVFGPRSPASILPGDLDRFVSQKKEEKLSEPRINRLLVIFKAILRYGIRNKALRELPEFPKPFSEAPYVRSGSIDGADWFVLSNALQLEKTPWLEAMLWAAYTFGFRVGELTYMRVSQIDFVHHMITLPAGSTKNRMPRRIVMAPDGPVEKLLARETKGKRPEQYVFSRDGGSTPVRDFRHVWNKMVKDAQITTGSGKDGKLLFHDLRRSAITRMREAGLTEEESMAVAGHLSVAVHRRYKQISEWDARQIAAKIDK